MKKINDTGEVLAGARKHLWAGFNKWAETDFEDPNADFLKSKVIPPFKVDKLLQAGVHESVIIALIVADNIIPRKPSSSWKRDRWNTRVSSMMQFIKELKYSDPQGNDIVNRRALLVKTFDGFDSKLKTALEIGLPMAQHLDGAHVKGGYTHPEQHVPCLVVYGPGGKFIKNVMTFDEGITLLKPLCVPVNSDAKRKPARKKYSFGVYTDKNTNEVFIAWGSNKRNPVRVLRNIGSVKEAFTILKTDEERVIDALERMRPANEYWNIEKLVRQGPQWSQDSFVSPEKLIECFGLRGVQYGNYVTQKERVELNLMAFNGMKDLADVLGLPDAAIGFDGDLGLAFGARGKGGSRFAAHFEPIGFNVNLTRGSGIGNFAHEFGHALSAYLYALGATGARNHFRVDGDISFNQGMSEFPDRLGRAVDSLNRVIGQTQVRERSSHLDCFRSKPYWGTLPEVFARCFERWVAYELEREDRCNGWLVSLKKSVESEYEFYPYSTQVELESGLAAAFRELFDSINAEDGVFSLGKIDLKLLQQLAS